MRVNFLRRVFMCSRVGAAIALALTCVAVPVHAQTFKVGSFTKTTVTAVSVQNQTSASVAAALTVSTASTFDPGTNANRLLVVGLSSDGTLTSPSVKYGTTSLTLVAGTSVSNGTTHTELWYLANPSTTAATVTATWTTTTRTVVMGVVAFNNVDQTTPISGAITSTGTSTIPSVTIVSRTGDMVLAVAGKLTNLGTEPATVAWHDVSRANQKGGGTTAVGAASVARTWAAAANSTVWSASGINVRMAAPQQVAHGLGITPSALILWTEGKTATGFSAGSMSASGISDGTTSRSVSTASQSAAGTSNTSRRSAAKALTMVQWSEVTIAEADLSSWDATNLNLSWTTNDTTGYVIHYLVIGGTSVQAKVVEWQAPAAGSTIDKAVATVGFQPNIVLHLTDGDSIAPPSSVATSSFSFGAMDGDNQWVTSHYSRDNQATMDTSHAQRTDNTSPQPSCILELGASQTIATEAHFVSMDSAGFTVHFGTNSTGNARIYSLALAGMNGKVGTFNKSTVTAAPAFVQVAAKNGGVVSSTTQAFAAASTTGNTIVVTVTWDSTATVSSVTDNKGNTYSLAAGPTTFSPGHAATYVASNIVGGVGAITITVTLSGPTASGLEVFQTEYSGLDTTNPVDQVSTASGNGAAMNSGSKTTAEDNELIYGFIGSTLGGITGGGTFTSRSVFDTQYQGDKLAVTAGSYSVDGTAAGARIWVAHMVTLRGARHQQVTAVEFQPTAVFFTSAQDLTVAAGTAAVNARTGFGAMDGSAEGSTASADLDNAATSSVQGYETTSKAFTKVNNATPTIDAAADFVSFDTDGFTLNWATNDNVATEILYLALAPLSVTSVNLVSLTATRYDARVLVQWRTALETDNLGFNVYREIGGVRTRVNASLIAGSAVQGVDTVQRYALWDAHPDAASESVVYWLEDVDLNTTTTLHGPATPAAGGIQTVDPAVTLSSTDVNDVGSPHDNRTVFYDIPDDPVRIGRRDLQWDLASQAAVKIGVKKAGWYRVAQPDLVAAGLDPAVDPHGLRLFLNGVEQAIRVNGEGDSRFDAADSIEFYGTGANTPYTDTRYYWLEAGVQSGLRITTVTDPVSGPAAPVSFTALRQRKDRVEYFAALNNGETENWFGPTLSPDLDAVDLTLGTLNVDRTAANAQLDVTLQGVTADVAHAIGVSVNGTDVGEVDFDGQSHVTQTLTVPIAVLNDGENTFTFTARGGQLDVSLVDLFGVRYAHTFDADGDLLRFTLDAGVAATIGGFGSSSIRVVDITDTAAAIELQGATQPQDGGLYSITVQAPGTGTRTLLAFSDPTIAVPLSIAANQPSAWHAAAESHDYVIVSHGDFIAKMAPLVALRIGEGHGAVAVNVEDVYDEFSFGEKTPLAIRDFLQWARATWQQAPQFVVLAGDATVDPRDYWEMGAADFVPTKQQAMTTHQLETASDDWFVDFDDDGLPDMAIGRLSVRTAAQAETVVGKIVGYGQAGPQPWNKNVVLAADQNDDTNFEASSESLAALVPQDFTTHRIYRAALGDAVAHQALIDQVDNGQFIVNYVGHGSVHIWDGGSPPLLQTPTDLDPTDDVRTSWQNVARLPLVVAMNCFNGLFNGVFDEESLAETLQRAANGGAIAVWASSADTPPPVQALADRELFRLIFTGQYTTVGEAVSAAKRAVANPDLRRSWIFFGDPAMRLNGQPAYVPPPPTPPPPPPPVPDPEPLPPASGGGSATSSPSPSPAASPEAPPAPAVPGAPQNLTSSVSGNTVTLTWSAPLSGGAALSYVIAAGAFSGSDDFVQDTGTGATSFTAGGVGVGTYFVRVLAANAAGVSVASNEVIVTITDDAAGPAPAPSTPGAPTGLRASVNGSTVTFSWLKGSGGAPQTYFIDAGSSSGRSDLASFPTGTAATAMSVAGVPAGTYYVRVRAANALGTSPASNEVVVFVAGVPQCATAPDAPIALHAIVSGSTVTLMWSAPAGSPISYVVEAGSRSGAADLVVTDGGNAGTIMVATDVGSGVYFVRVRARNACGTSAASNEAVIVVP